MTNFLPASKHVGGADDAVHRGLPRAVTIVEEVLGHRIVHRDDWELQHLVCRHGPQADHAGGRFLGAADDPGQQLAALLVDGRNQIRAVVHRHLRLVVQAAPMCL